LDEQYLLQSLTKGRYNEVFYQPNRMIRTTKKIYSFTTEDTESTGKKNNLSSVLSVSSVVIVFLALNMETYDV